jgi:hypothetical protein
MSRHHEPHWVVVDYQLRRPEDFEQLAGRLRTSPLRLRAIARLVVRQWHLAGYL